jgi:hypothetical protein
MLCLDIFKLTYKVSNAFKQILGIWIFNIVTIGN